MNAAGGRRDSISLYADILWAIEPGHRKTHIVYKANMNFSRCKRYMDELLGMGLIEVKTRSPPMWTVTERGREFLEKHMELRGLLPPIESFDHRVSPYPFFSPQT